MHTDTEYLRGLSENKNLPTLMREALRDAAAEIDRLREWAEMFRNAITVEVKQAGTDADGTCRVIATTTPMELAKGPSLVYKRAKLVLQPNALGKRRAVARPLEQLVMRRCRWMGCKNRIASKDIACWLHRRIERNHSMNRCKEAFEEWFGFTVDTDMDIQTSVAWENWQHAWKAARESLTDKAEENAYDRTCSMWLTAATSDREKYAYRDGHSRGWRDATEHLTHNARS